MARVLIMPMAPGGALAHAGACHTIARGLAARGHEAILAYGGARPELLADGGHRVVAAAEIPDHVMRQDMWLGEPENIETMVRADRAVIEREQPDVVIADARASASIAAQEAGVPDIGLCHFLGFMPWSTASRLPGRPWVRRARHPAMALGRWWDARGRDHAAGARWTLAVNEVRRAHGLPAIVNGVSGGVVIACTSTPLTDPVESMPPHWRYVGHLSWSAGGPDAELPELGDRPVVYVTQGSTGDPAALRRTVRDLASVPVEVLVTTAGLCEPSELEALAPNVTAARYLPGSACLRRASVAVIHGGHLTASDAHLNGTPVVVVPHLADHWIWAARVQRMGTGIPVEGPLLPGRIRRAVTRVLADRGYQRRTSQAAAELATWDACANVEAIVRELAGR